ncbi:hypothetical protein GCM10022284_12770 [Streptomyces hundungensis]
MLVNPMSAGSPHCSPDASDARDVSDVHCGIAMGPRYDDRPQHPPTDAGTPHHLVATAMDTPGRRGPREALIYADRRRMP